MPERLVQTSNLDPVDSNSPDEPFYLEKDNVDKIHIFLPGATPTNDLAILEEKNGRYEIHFPKTVGESSAMVILIRTNRDGMPYSQVPSILKRDIALDPTDKIVLLSEPQSQLPPITEAVTKAATLNEAVQKIVEIAKITKDSPFRVGIITFD